MPKRSHQRLGAHVALAAWLTLGLAITAASCDILTTSLVRTAVPAYVLILYDLVLVSLGVLVRGFSSSNRGIPFLLGCSRKGGVRGFLCLLNLVECPTIPTRTFLYSQTATLLRHASSLHQCRFRQCICTSPQTASGRRFAPCRPS